MWDALSSLPPLRRVSETQAMRSDTLSLYKPVVDCRIACGGLSRQSPKIGSPAAPYRYLYNRLSGRLRQATVDLLDYQVKCACQPRGSIKMTIDSKCFKSTTGTF
jgi:hypothetical protein